LGACFGDQGGGGNPPAGNGTCEELFGCIGQCPEVGGMADQACQQACIDGTSQEGFDQAVALSTCAQESNCETNACVEEACAAEFGACFGEAAVPMGMGSCNDFLTCLGDENTTRDQCIEQTSPASYATFEAIIACGDANMCADDACLNEECDAEIRTCISDGRMFGMADCGTTWDCVLNCGEQDQGCVETCVDAASEDGFFGV
jgi:hypothetical protein